MDEGGLCCRLLACCSVRCDKVGVARGGFQRTRLDRRTDARTRLDVCQRRLRVAQRRQHAVGRRCGGTGTGPRLPEATRRAAARKAIGSAPSERIRLRWMSVASTMAAATAPSEHRIRIRRLALKRSADFSIFCAPDGDQARILGRGADEAA